jgi:hypothetical protein
MSMEESRQFQTYKKHVRARNVSCCNALLSRLIQFHGDDRGVPPISTEPEPEMPEPEERVLEITLSDPAPPPSFQAFLSAMHPGCPTIRAIKLCVCSHFNLTMSEIDSVRRTANVMVPRQIAYYLARKLTSRSLPEIGRKFGGRDHTTVLHSANKIERLIQTDANIAATVKILEARLQ